jgi:hypothetical protein
MRESPVAFGHRRDFYDKDDAPSRGSNLYYAILYSNRGYS